MNPNPNKNTKHDLNDLLAERMSGFVPRDAQQKMALLIEEALTKRQNALIEAGTGTGKTFAYLLPVLASNKKVIVSTGTKNLQDQLFVHDLPFINESFFRSVALLKGRANYLCLEQLHKNLRQTTSDHLEHELQQLVKVHDWSTSTATGDLTEVLDEEDMGRVQRSVTSTADNCLGSDCQHFDQCFLYKARQRALEADVVVVNHHLFFADLALKEDDLAELLPHAEVVVIDEAHQIEEVARSFYGQRFSSGQVMDLVNDAIREQQELGLDDPELIKAAEGLRFATEQLVGVALNQGQTIEKLIQSDLVEEFDLAISNLISRLRLSAERSHGMSRCYSRLSQLSDLFTMLTEAVDDAEAAHWLETTHRGFVIHLLPLDVASHLSPLLKDKARTWLFVSATLATTAGHNKEGVDDKTFRHFKQAIGFDDGLVARYPSPFAFPEQVAGFVPKVPDPGDSEHTAGLIASVLPLIRTHQGRSLLLFTSHRALSQAADLLSLEHDLAVMAQGALAKPKLIEKFRQTQGAVLLATHSFWEGVDLSGSDLKLLMIDKLPFTHPDDPVFQAKLRAIEKAGGNSFAELSLPKAAVTLKQGFGRLIRAESDRGLFVLGDPRLKSKSYGKVLRNCLPDFPWLEEMSEAMEYLEKLSKWLYWLSILQAQCVFSVSRLGTKPG